MMRTEPLHIALEDAARVNKEQFFLVGKIEVSAFSWADVPLKILNFKESCFSQGALRPGTPKHRGSRGLTIWCQDMRRGVPAPSASGILFPLS